MTSNPIDDFADVTRWMPVASGLARLTITARHEHGRTAMQLEFDFGAGGGFVVARRTLDLDVPETWVLAFDLRGAGPRNNLEIKLADESGRNVWWFKREAFALPETWQEIRLRSSDLQFAWGPAGGGPLRHAGAIEIAIAAGPGGVGSLAIANLRIEDHTYRETPRLSASSGSEPATLPEVGWRSAPAGGDHWLAIDFGVARELGGIVIDWEPGLTPAAMIAEISDDGASWEERYTAGECDGRRSYVYLPATTSRHVRLQLTGTAAGVGIARLEVKPFEFSRSIDAFFRNIAADTPRGAYPKYWSNEQTYWSPIGSDDGGGSALINEEGMIETAAGGCSIEPFLLTGDRLITWADATIEQSLADAYLPIPSVLWRGCELDLEITAAANSAADGGAVLIRYRLRNRGAVERSVRLFAALRPFQVTPPWQSFRNLGGVSRIDDVRREGDDLLVNGVRVAAAITPPDGFGAAAFAQGSIVDFLRTGELPAHDAAHDELGWASAALAFDATLSPGGVHDVFLAISRPEQSLPTDASEAFARSTDMWRDKLGAIGIEAPLAAQPYFDTLRTAAAHILVCRDGAALQPGPRRYTRSWIRDGAVMSAALLRVGCTAEATAFIRWYAQFQADDGNVPCCVDRTGVDWLVEHDSHGQLVFTVMECFRFSRDRELLHELWPHVRKAVDYIEALRASRMGSEFEHGERRACHGLLPESASHEGYLAHPVHAYWDDLWAVRGLRDAAAIAAELGDGVEARRAVELGDRLRESLRASIASVMADRDVAYVPSSVEWADFDPTAMAVAASLLDEVEALPEAALHHTFDTYLEGFRKRCRGEIDWANYTAYEIRIAAALIRLGRRDDAVELMAFLLDDRRPRVWNQWPEITWRDMRSPGHIGDLPHAWIAGEYLLAARSMLVYERESARTLVIGAGVPAAWLEGDGIRATGLPTYFGDIDVHMRRSGAHSVHISLAGRLRNRGVTVALQPPLPGPLVSAVVDGRAVDIVEPDCLRIIGCPREVELTVRAG